MKSSFRIGRTDLALPKLMAAVWVFWLLAAIALPFTYEGGDWIAAGVISSGYAFATILMALVFAGATRRSAGRPVRRLESSTGVRRYAVAGLVGAACLVYDRLGIQRIDLTAGIASARLEWAALGEQRLGISSVYSAVGNLLWAFAYVPIVYGHLFFESLRARGKGPLLAVALGLGAVVVVSALNGGRMPIVFSFAALVCTAAIRRSHGLPIVPPFSFAARSVLALGGFVMATYVPFVLIDRAAANNSELPDYTESSISYLRGVPTPAWTERDQRSDLLAVTSLSVAQLVHPFWVFEVVRKDDHREGAPMLVSTPLFLLQKLGLFRGAENTWTYSGLYLSLPGAAFHDAGWPGLVFMAVGQGLCLAWAGAMLRRVSPLRLAFVLAVGVVTVLSPLVPAFLAGPFPFMVFALVVPAIFQRVVFGRPAASRPAVPVTRLSSAL